MSAVTTHRLSVGYSGTRGDVRTVLQDLDLAVETGQFVCLLGPNGAGKSTLLRTLAGVQPPLAGEVRLNERNIRQMSAADRARQVAVVLTERITPGLLTGWALVALGRIPYTGFLGTLSQADEDAVQRAVEQVGAESLADRPVVELSDGERQKLLIARALAQEAPVILLDEPTAFLDAPRRVEILTLLRTLAHETRRAVIVSTHEVHLALELADALWLTGGHGDFTVGKPADILASGAFAAVFPTLRL